MATVETPVEVPPSETVYDGFISYSHAADDLLAPRLQAGLQRFAKPWWKRRALRIFRDEASLAANPHLWSSITDALDGSGWFVLLLSPEAANSEWVNKEIDYWLEHKDSNRVIPVVTDGDFAWHDGDVAGDATPQTLHGVFADEPRWVDLRFARSEEQLDLNNASFRAAVADVASAIRGVPKDELESEEVRQHRRTRRTAVAAGVALVALTIAASGAALLAVDRGNEANEQRLAAEESAAEADAQRQVAEAETARAETEQARAEQLEFEARTDALAARAIAQLDVDPELALLLATEALSRDVNAETLSATHTALQRNRTVFLVAAEPGRFTPTAGAVGGLSPDASSVVVAGQGRELALWEVGGVEPVWSVEFPIETTEILDARFSEDGTAIVALVGGQVSENPALDPAQLVVFDAATGAEIASVPDVGCRHFQIDPSPLGPYVDLDRPIPWMRPNVHCSGPLKHAGLIDPLTGSFTTVADLPGLFGRHRFGVPTIDDQVRRFAYGSDGPGQVIDLETGDVLFTFDEGNATLSADGSLLLARGGALARPLELWSLSTGALLWAFDDAFTRAWFSDDGSMVYGTNPAGSITVLDTATGEVRFRLGEHTGPPLGAVMSRDSRRMASFGTDFTARVWDLGSTLGEGAAYQTNSQARVHLGASAHLAGGVVAVWGGDLQQEDALWEIVVIDLETGDPLATVTGGMPALSPDGTRLAYRAVEEVTVSVADLKTAGEPGVRPRLGPIEVLDIASGEVVLEIELACEVYLMPKSVAYGTGCPVVGGGREWDLEFSPDGRWLGLADSYDRIVTVWDTGTGEVIARTTVRGGVPRAVAFSPDSSRVAFHDETSQTGSGRDVEAIIVLKDVDPTRDVDQLTVTVESLGIIRYEGDVAFAEMLFTPDGSHVIAAASNGDIVFIEVDEWELLSPIAAHGGRALDVSVNEAGTLVASAGDDGFVRVWSFEDRSLVTEIDFEVDEIANVEFIDDTHLFVTPGFGNEAVVITLDPDELLEFARSRIFRSFTPEECLAFSIDDCPTG